MTQGDNILVSIGYFETVLASSFNTFEVKGVLIDVYDNNYIKWVNESGTEQPTVHKNCIKSVNGEPNPEFIQV